MQKTFRGKKILKYFEWLATKDDTGYFKFKGLDDVDALMIIRDIITKFGIDVDLLAKALTDMKAGAVGDVEFDEEDDVEAEEGDDEFVNN